MTRSKIAWLLSLVLVLFAVSAAAFAGRASATPSTDGWTWNTNPDGWTWDGVLPDGWTWD